MGDINSDKLFGRFQTYTKSNSIILKTTDGGDNWIRQKKSNFLTNIIKNVFSKYSGLFSVFFIDKKGWIVGANGIVLKTIDGGITWNSQNIQTKNYLLDIFFVNSETGWIVGSEGTIYKTTNSGKSWNSQINNTNNHLFSVFFINKKTGCIVGSNGTILTTSSGGKKL